MPLDTGTVGRLHLVADADVDDAPVAAYQPSLNEGSDLGVALKSARQFRGLTTQDVADATRIRQAYIEALEDMRLEDLPSRPFTTAYSPCGSTALSSIFAVPLGASSFIL